ncbi:hypothetical protein EYF80_031433 [Liparis tanakae]|uniref:Uncharacterized protein n=1 Tax=Liparis tanakae TaxID=230148 RepID=A0A4Z2GYN5_9TELE|nr:hypothetical protein EYF80_031433 [Liparis tanakae]
MGGSCQSLPLALAVSKVAQILWRMDEGILKALGPVWDVMVQSVCLKNGTDSFSVWRKTETETEKQTQIRPWSDKSFLVVTSLESHVDGVYWVGTIQTAAEPHLGHGRVDLQNLLVTFDLAHADFAGELGGGGAESLQREGTVQGLLVAAPHLREGELLRRQRENKKTGHRETELGNILDGHLEAEGVRSKRQHLRLFEELTTSGLLCSHHSLEGRRKGKEQACGVSSTQYTRRL